MTRNHDIAAAFMVLSVGWPLLGFAAGFFAQLPAEAGYRDVAVLIPVLIFLPLVRSVTRWTALGTGIIGIISVLSSLYGLVTVPTALLFGPAVALVARLVFTYSALTAYWKERLM